ncbi:uncharacterized protein BT62DRAFT_552268 [Guyanagaster necrorhizus]|uniref:Uncharacterized protein n=1 Tax=Guyanagaster necrorhizus TaxID=856835 RepID=A0A9P7VIH7_9AGAR|nr:uncharacterized protein BT62DRAFT_552268 [Guyanagaster necrorhizus MCA 3950]KAG7441147.1 hypothetical protein BT62DRAFT_552268 [Guyanagaster necrorhizus MCA 3950]
MAAKSRELYKEALKEANEPFTFPQGRRSEAVYKARNAFNARLFGLFSRNTWPPHISPSNKALNCQTRRCTEARTKMGWRAEIPDDDQMPRRVGMTWMRVGADPDSIPASHTIAEPGPSLRLYDAYPHPAPTGLPLVLEQRVHSWRGYSPFIVLSVVSPCRPVNRYLDVDRWSQHPSSLTYSYL